MTEQPQDPHPDNEEQYREQRHPGGTPSAPKDINKVNSYTNDGKPLPKPKNGQGERNS